MDKKISFSARGQRADIGDMIIYRILPNRYADAVGPFVFLDHIIPTIHPDDDNSNLKLQKLTGTTLPGKYGEINL